VDTRTLQEVYLPAFRDAVRDGAASSVMCAYSSVNGTYACQHPYLLTTALRDQFGFGGFVTSDWGATHATASATAGLDQDMPGGDAYYGSALSAAVASGTVSRATLDRMAGRILTEMFAFGLFDAPRGGSPAQPATSAAHVTAARDLAAEGTVLLRNTGVLPFGAPASIAVIGADAGSGALTEGGGSAGVNSSGTVTPLAGITARAGSGSTVRYDDGSSTSSAAALAGSSTVAVVFAGKSEGEGGDLSNIDLSTSDNNLIAAVAAANPRTVVVLNTGSAVTMPWLSQVAGVLEAWYPGQEDGDAIAGVLFGDTNPSGHLPVTFPTSLAQVPAHTTAQWPGSNGTVQYSEGLQVGYRWYAAQHLTPLFPFGHGLSYTSFAFSGLHVDPLPRGGAATVSATVTNTGSRQGADVVQLYLTDPASAGEPAPRLAGFARVDLAPGASQTVRLPLTQDDLAHWDTTTSAFTASTGDYGVAVGDSAGHLPLTGTLTVTADQLGHPLTLTNPGPQSGATGVAVSLPVVAADSTGQTPAFSATGLPAGTAITSTGTVTGTPTTPGTSTVTVTARDTTGATDTATFTWTVTAPALASTPLVGVGGVCLDLASDNNTNRTKVEIYTCNGTSGQQWSAWPDGTLRAAGKCLDVAGGATANGSPVQLYDCNGSGAQVWQRKGGALVNPQSGRCLDDPGASTAIGTQVQLYDCNGTAAQNWQPPAPTGPITGSGGLCLDVRSASTADGTPVQLYGCNGTDAQNWAVPTDGTLRALGKCLDVTSAGTADGTPVQLYTCNGTGAQTWQPQGAELVNPHSGKCLHDTGSGTQATITTCTGTADQQWQIP
jgi:beta-glucosidase